MTNLTIMTAWQKHLAFLAVVAGLPLAAASGALGQDAPAQGSSPGERIETLLAELAEPGRADWERVEAEIIRTWARSGSPSMDLLLRRGNEAMENENLEQALEHLSALVDHAPEFAEGWNARATAYFLLGEYRLSIADIERTLMLNPNHFGALAGLGYMFDQMGDPVMALEALRAAEALNPNRENVSRTIERIERQVGVAEL